VRFKITSATRSSNGTVAAKYSPVGEIFTSSKLSFLVKELTLTSDAWTDMALNTNAAQTATFLNRIMKLSLEDSVPAMARAKCGSNQPPL
jgi:hypothetical protein